MRKFLFSYHIEKEKIEKDTNIRIVYVLRDWELLQGQIIYRRQNICNILSNKKYIKK